MNGLLLIDKEKDMTSRDVVNIVCKHLNTKKIGHTGTLDPNATGVLVLCIGNALKIVDLITAYNKTYIGEVILGIGTDTLDITGEVLEKKVVKNITKDQINEVLETFVGDIDQEVPIYSAVKVDGKKLYEYARENIPVILPIKQINIKTLELIGDIIYEEETIKFNIKCDVSKGTYIRSLIRDIGYKLNTPACMGDLKRIKQGDYKIENCYTLDDIKNKSFEVINMNKALNDYPFVKVDKELEIKILNGAVLPKFFEDNICVIINNEDKVIGIYEIYEKDDSKVKPINIFK